MNDLFASNKAASLRAVHRVSDEVSVSTTPLSQSEQSVRPLRLLESMNAPLLEHPVGLQRALCFLAIVAVGCGGSADEASSSDGRDVGATEQASSSGCHGDEYIAVNGTGLFVNSITATFTNVYASTRCGRQEWWNVDSDFGGPPGGLGPSVCIRPGDRYAYWFKIANDFPNGDQVCVRFSGDPNRDTPCEWIHR
jgi:hypothetical protein